MNTETQNNYKATFDHILQSDPEIRNFISVIEDYTIGSYLGEIALKAYLQLARDGEMYYPEQNLGYEYLCEYAQETAIMALYPNKRKPVLVPNINDIDGDKCEYGREVIKAAVIDGISMLFAPEALGFDQYGKKAIADLTAETLEAIDDEWISAQAERAGILYEAGQLSCSILPSKLNAIKWDNVPRYIESTGYVFLQLP